MKKNEIYYFSGTGNSLFAARQIAARTNARLISVASACKGEKITTDADTIGFVFPVYDFKCPGIIESIVRKFSSLEERYIFAVGTFGIAPSGCMKKFNAVLEEVKGSLSAGFALKMPHNGIGSAAFSDGHRAKTLSKASDRLAEITSYIMSRKTGVAESGGIARNVLGSGALFRLAPALIKLVSQILAKGVSSLALALNEKCDGCGLCAKVCPVENIRLERGRPLWMKRCAGCLACLHWCPRDAIQLGSSGFDIRKYHHPEIRLNDILMQKKNAL